MSTVEVEMRMLISMSESEHCTVDVEMRMLISMSESEALNSLKEGCELS